jgi:hypothetical protein
MEAARDFLINLLAEGTWFLLGVLATPLVYLVSRIIPARQLWNLNAPGETIICVSASHRGDTGEYIRPATGIGQLRAVAVALGSLDVAYRRIRFKNILMSDEALGRRVENDLILFGGPKNNPITRIVLERVQAKYGVEQDERRICWHTSLGPAECVPIVESRKVKKDIGLVIRTRNPLSRRKSTVCVFSGGHTFGTVAAVDFFIDHYGAWWRLWKRLPRTLIAVVECDVLDDYHVNTRLVREQLFWRT